MVGPMSFMSRKGKGRRDSRHDSQSSSSADAALVAAAMERVIYVDDAFKRDTVCDVVNGLAQAFYHIPFAVCGVAAMVYYGYEDFVLNSISILCPEESRDAILCWARSQNMPIFNKEKDSFGYRLADGRVCSVRVRTQDSQGFSDLDIVPAGPFRAPVLSLPSLIIQFARDYMCRLDDSSIDLQERYGRDILWMLDIIGYLQRDEQSFTPRQARKLLTRGFWLPFTLSFPESIEAFNHAGFFECLTWVERRDSPEISDSVSAYSRMAPNAMERWLANASTLSVNSVPLACTDSNSLESSSQTSVLEPDTKFRRGEPDLNKRLPALPEEAHQPPLVPGQTYTRGFPDLDKALPPLPAEAFDVEPPVYNISSFASRMIAKGLAKLMPPVPPRLQIARLPIDPLPAFIILREQVEPPRLRKMTQNLPAQSSSQARSDRLTCR